MPDPLSQPLLTMRGIVKRCPGVVALGGVSLHLGRGEVLALMGENGAGKSTLMKILGGAYQPDAGEIAISHKRVVLHSIAEAKRQGIALIHQELMLAPNLDIAGNIFLGNEDPGGGLFGPLRGRAMRTATAPLLQRGGLPPPPHTPLSSPPLGDMQMVEVPQAPAKPAPP